MSPGSRVVCFFFFKCAAPPRPLPSSPTPPPPALPAAPDSESVQHADERLRHQLGDDQREWRGRLLQRRLEPQPAAQLGDLDRKSTRLNSSHSQISYAVFCLQKKKPTDHLSLLPQT